ncbi:MAG: hypothetical protein KDD25_04355 [Bdellovibrionales bacterium]|nr:hypothetical protein [Bdellovibrionales bacterium]
MGCVFDSHLTEEQKNLAQIVVEELGLNNLNILYKEPNLHFVQDRRVVHVPLNLVRSGSWSEIRYLFRAVLGSSPSAWNLSAPNTWGPSGPDYSEQ